MVCRNTSNNWLTERIKVLFCFQTKKCHINRIRTRTIMMLRIQFDTQISEHQKRTEKNQKNRSYRAGYKEIIAVVELITNRHNNRMWFYRTHESVQFSIDTHTTLSLIIESSSVSFQIDLYIFYRNYSAWIFHLSHVILLDFLSDFRMLSHIDFTETNPKNFTFDTEKHEKSTNFFSLFYSQLPFALGLLTVCCHWIWTFLGSFFHTQEIRFSVPIFCISLFFLYWGFSLRLKSKRKSNNYFILGAWSSGIWPESNTQENRIKLYFCWFAVCSKLKYRETESTLSSLWLLCVKQTTILCWNIHLRWIYRTLTEWEGAAHQCEGERTFLFGFLFFLFFRFPFKLCVYAYSARVRMHMCIRFPLRCPVSM